LKDLLSSEDRQDYENIVNTTGLASHRNISGRPHQSYVRTPIDGYIVSYTYPFFVGSKQSGPFEPSTTGVQYTFPVYFWTEKTWVYGTDTDAIVKVFFS
jgi:hypothetical protein